MYIYVIIYIYMHLHIFSFMCAACVFWVCVCASLCVIEWVRTMHVHVCARVCTYERWCCPLLPAPSLRMHACALTCARAHTHVQSQSWFDAYGILARAYTSACTYASSCTYNRGMYIYTWYIWFVCSCIPTCTSMHVTCVWRCIHICVDRYI